MVHLGSEKPIIHLPNASVSIPHMLYRATVRDASSRENCTNKLPLQLLLPLRLRPSSTRLDTLSNGKRKWDACSLHLLWIRCGFPKRFPKRLDQRLSSRIDYNNPWYRFVCSVYTVASQVLGLRSPRCSCRKPKQTENCADTKVDASLNIESDLNMAAGRTSK